MFPACPVLFFFSLFGLVLGPSGQQRHRVGTGPIRAKAQVAEQKYCSGDADLFTVSLKLDVEVSNPARETIILAPTMIPWVARVAVTVKDAELGRFLYEIIWSHYPQSPTLGDRVSIDPGKTATLRTVYGLVAKYDPAFTYPKTLSTGSSYAIVLVLKPETTQPSQKAVPRPVESVTTDPFLINVPRHPPMVDCEHPSGGRKRP